MHLRQEVQYSYSFPTPTTRQAGPVPRYTSFCRELTSAPTNPGQHRELLKSAEDGNSPKKIKDPDAQQRNVPLFGAVE